MRRIAGLCGWATLCAALGVLAAWPYRNLDSSLPMWFVLAPIFRLVVFAPNRWRAALYGFSFAIVWTILSFSFLWRNAFEGSIALSIYTALTYTGALLIVRIPNGRAVTGLARQACWSSLR